MPSVTQIRTPTKRFLKSNFDWIRKLILSFFFYLELKRLIRSYTPIVPSKSIPDSRPKWVKSAPNGVKTSTIPSGAAHTYMGYIREYPARVVCERCPMVWPFIWKLFCSTFTGYYIFFSALWTVLNFVEFHLFRLLSVQGSSCKKQPHNASEKSVAIVFHNRPLKQ